MPRILTALLLLVTLTLVGCAAPPVSVLTDPPSTPAAPVVAQPPAAGPAKAEPVTPERVTARPTTAKPAIAESSPADPITDVPTLPRPKQTGSVQTEPAIPISAGARPEAGVAATKASTPEMAALLIQVEAYVKTVGGTWGVYVIDLHSGGFAALNGERSFFAASTVKLPMAMYILHLVELGKADLGERVRYAQSDWEEGSGSLQYAVTPESAYTVRELISLAITQSDNIAANMLMRRFGRYQVHQYMRSLGGTVTITESGANATTPHDMALYLQKLWAGEAITDPALRDFLLDQLFHTVFAERIAAGVPAGVPVAHKVGTWDGVVNDIGLVEHARDPFILAVFGADVGEEEGKAVIAEIARIVYQFAEDRR